MFHSGFLILPHPMSRYNQEPSWRGSSRADERTWFRQRKSHQTHESKRERQIAIRISHLICLIWFSLSSVWFSLHSSRFPHHLIITDPFFRWFLPIVFIWEVMFIYKNELSHPTPFITSSVVNSVSSSLSLLDSTSRTTDEVKKGYKNCMRKVAWVRFCPLPILCAFFLRREISVATNGEIGSNIF